MSREAVRAGPARRPRSDRAGPPAQSERVQGVERGRGPPVARRRALRQVCGGAGVGAPALSARGDDAAREARRAHGELRKAADAHERTVDPVSAFLAPTRYYGDPDERAEEKGRIEKSWSEIYKLTDTVPVVISDAAMLRYGVSATPTFVFVDRRGIVKRYSPTRLSEERLSAAIDELLR